MATYSDPTTIIPSGDAKKLDTGPILAIVAAVIAVLAAGFFYYQVYSVNKQATSVQQDIVTKEAAVTKLQDVSSQITTAQNQAKELHSVFDNQVIWSTVLTTLGQHLYRNMAITSLQMDQSGTLIMKGYTVDFVNYAKIYSSLTDSTGSKYFSNVKPSSVQKVQKTDGEVEVDFVFAMKLLPTIMPVQPTPLATPGA